MNIINKFQKISTVVREESAMTVQYVAYFNPKYGYCIIEESKPPHSKWHLVPCSFFIQPYKGILSYVSYENGIISESLKMNEQIASTIVDCFDHWPPESHLAIAQYDDTLSHTLDSETVHKICKACMDQVESERKENN